jgi:hypothetical protein
MIGSYSRDSNPDGEGMLDGRSSNRVEEEGAGTMYSVRGSRIRLQRAFSV